MYVQEWSKIESHEELGDLHFSTVHIRHSAELSPDSGTVAQTSDPWQDLFST